MIRGNNGNVGQKRTILLPAWAMAVALSAFGATPIVAQSVEPQSRGIPTSTSAQTLPEGNAEEAPQISWDRPSFLGSPNNMGSPYVPLDSWIYPAFERLIALGYVRSAVVAQRP